MGPGVHRSIIVLTPPWNPKFGADVPLVGHTIDKWVTVSGHVVQATHAFIVPLNPPEESQ